MAIEFHCPHCGVLYKLDEKYAGKMGKCKNAKCQQQILIPFESTVPAATVPGVAVKPSKPVDAETLAAEAFSDDRLPAPSVPDKPVATPVAKKIGVTCTACEHKFDVEATLAGKNTKCPECGKIFRVPKIIEDKPLDWRNTNANKPSMAKSAEPVPAGVWDGQARGVSGEALRKANALQPEDDEEPGERRIRRLKQGLYTVAILGIGFLAVRYVQGLRREARDDGLMDRALREIADKEQGSAKPEFHSGVHRLAGEYGVRDATKADDLQKALTHFDKARDQVQNLPAGNEDRSGMLAELGAALVVCGGTAKQLDDDVRLPWDKVHPLIRKCIDKLPPNDLEVRTRALRMLTRRLAEHDQGPLAATIARNSSSEAEQPETLGRVGIELFLLNKKDQAEQVLAKLPALAQPAATALWLALHPDASRPPANVAHVPPPVAGPKGTDRSSRLAYAEGLALQGKFDEALAVARMSGSPADQIQALARVASAAVDTGKPEAATQAIETILNLAKIDSKQGIAPPWVLANAAEQAARAGRWEAVAPLLDAIRDTRVRAWGKLYVLRAKLAGQPQTKADEQFLDAFEADAATLAQVLAQAEVARHNAAAGIGSYAASMKALPPGGVRPFGLAGTALGTQDRNPH